MYHDLFGQMKKTLGQLDKWLDTAETHAKAKSFDAAVLLSARLAPDQFPCSRQVQIACDTAKLGISRVTGKAAPSHADTETTVAELRARVASVLAYLDTFKASDFEGSDSRVITQPRWEGKTMTGHDYFVEHVVPNFFFHATHVYAILRHNGVGLGKGDYLGTLSKK
ncbi:MAG: DUF1993 domain-containing protein [Kofleriaceae bacterium]|nr:DUF1993 domain-containing protein [Kofleriaceae bacterium]